MKLATNRRFVLAGLAAVGLVSPLWQADALAAVRKKKKRRRKKARKQRNPYTPMAREGLKSGETFHLVVSLREQKAHAYAGTQLIGTTRISSGKPGYDTPRGIFTVMEKRRHHRSNIYGSSMPFMQRLTWSGIALHQGPVPNRPASHGCVRLPRSFAGDLFKIKTRNRHVIIANHMPQLYETSSSLLFQPAPRETASLDAGNNSDASATLQDDAPLRILLTRHRGKHRLSRVQFMLQRLGFYKGRVDGQMGRGTWRALVDFQKSVGMKPTGLIKGATLPVLETAYGVEESPAGHLYVRQNQKPVFDMPVHLVNGHERLGTHLFTMGQPNVVTRKAPWTALTVEGLDLGGAGAALAALQRFDVPRPAKDRIEQMLTAHSSLAISDWGLGPETGKGTDFIVTLP